MKDRPVISIIFEVFVQCVIIMRICFQSSDSVTFYGKCTGPLCQKLYLSDENFFITNSIWSYTARCVSYNKFLNGNLFFEQSFWLKFSSVELSSIVYCKDQNFKKKKTLGKITTSFLFFFSKNAWRLTTLLSDLTAFPLKCPTKTYPRLLPLLRKLKATNESIFLENFEISPPKPPATLIASGCQQTVL